MKKTMKTLICNKLKSTVSLLIISLLMTLPVNAQKVDCAKVADSDSNKLPTLLRSIGEEDFSNFLNVMSLKKYSNIIYEGLSVDCYKGRQFNLTGKGKNIELDVTYGNNGNLIKGRLIKIDSHIPFLIRKHVSAYSLEGWKMISNKIYIIDFNPDKTEYEIELMRKDEKMTIFFDCNGRQIKRLTRA